MREYRPAAHTTYCLHHIFVFIAKYRWPVLRGEAVRELRELIREISKKRKFLMTRYTQLALMVCVAVAGTAVEARADCHKVRGSIAETSIPSNDPIGRLLGTVTGVLNGASTVYITSRPPHVTSFDVFLTTAGDVLIATGVPTRTSVPDEPGEFISHVALTVIGGSGKYAEATGTMTFDGRSHTGTVPPTTDLVYEGTVCGPNVNGGGK